VRNAAEGVPYKAKTTPLPMCYSASRFSQYVAPQIGLVQYGSIVSKPNDR
jgi:hypothetical protein